ncbi:MAG: NAD(P)H-dependent oxidoreductase [Myxococcota bacterium]
MGHLIVGIAGSLRNASINRALLERAESMLPEGVDFRFASIRELPLYDGDLEAEGIASVEALKADIAAATGVLIATPEYNYGIPGPLKNALDWASRPAYKSVFAQRRVGILSASPGPSGGIRAQGHLKQVLLGMAAEIYAAPEAAVAGATRGEDGRLVLDARQEQRLRRYVEGFVAFAAAGSASS